MIRFLFILLPFLSFSQVLNDFDKHCYVSQEITKAVAMSVKNSTQSTPKAVLSGFLSSLVVGTAKEVYDCYKPNKTGFSKIDLSADAWGSIVGSLQFCIVIDIFHKRVENRVLE